MMEYVCSNYASKYGHFSPWWWINMDLSKNWRKWRSSFILVSHLWILNADCSKLTRLAHFKPMWPRIYMVIAIQRGMCPLWRAPTILVLICIGTVKSDVLGSGTRAIPVPSPPSLNRHLCPITVTKSTLLFCERFKVSSLLSLHRH